MTCSRSPNEEVTKPTFEPGSHSKCLSDPKSQEIKGVGSQRGGPNLSPCPKWGSSAPHLCRRGISVLPFLSVKPHPGQGRADRPVLR